MTTKFSSEELRKSRSGKKLNSAQDRNEVIEIDDSPETGLINTVDMKSLDFDFEDEDEDIEQEHFDGMSSSVKLSKLFKKAEVLKSLDSFLENEGYDISIRTLVRSSLKVSLQ